MTRSRGNHRSFWDTRLPSATASVDDEQDDQNDEATPASWWVKTIASWALLAGAVGLLGVLVVIPRLSGSTAYTVLTGSMEPAYPPGTMIVVKPTPGDQLNPGDVITFQPESGNPAVVTHRIVSTFYDGQGKRRFITKGDANKVQDETQLVEEQIRGRLLYSVPYIGRINSWVPATARSAAVFVVAGGLGAYALWMWGGGLRDRSRRQGRPVSVADQSDGRPGPATGELDLPTVTFGVPGMPTCRACGAAWETPPPPLGPRQRSDPAPQAPGRPAQITQPLPTIE